MAAGRLTRIGGAASEVLLAVIGLLAVFSPAGWDNLTLALWIVVALVYLIGAALGVRRSSRSGAVTTPRPQGPLQRVLVSLAPVLAGVIGLGAALTSVFAESLYPGIAHDDAIALRILGVAAIPLSWMLLHYGFGRRYRMLYERLGGGLEFPEVATPALIDYQYFAFTLGTTFATSDVNVTSRRMRWVVLQHAVLSFFFNAIVLAVAFKFMTGG